MNNNTLANELITRCAGFPAPFRGMIQEAARRLLQMVPDHPAKAGAMEADSLRQLVSEWPVTNRPPLLTSDEWLRCVCTAAADRIEQMSETIDYGRQIHAENVRLTAELEALKIDKLNLIAMVEELEKARAERDALLVTLKHYAPCEDCGNWDLENEMCVCPVNCICGEEWTWRGAKDDNVPTKKED